MGCGGSKDTQTTNSQSKNNGRANSKGNKPANGDQTDSQGAHSQESLNTEEDTKSNHKNEDDYESADVTVDDVSIIRDDVNAIRDDVSVHVSVKSGTKNAKSKGQGGQNGKRATREQREPVNEKGYKKRIRENMRQATKGYDLEELENAIVLFEKNKLEDNGDCEDAKDRLEFLSLRKGLRDAILRRHPGILDKAINDAEASTYQSDLQHYIDRARELRQHLTELDQYRHDILEMDQSTISEIRSYHHPPLGVHETMTSTYLILGYDENKLRDWVDVQSLLGRYGKESLIREIKNADTVNLDEDTTKRVNKLQSKFTQDQVRSISAGCATFYVWNNNMCQKFSNDQSSSDNKKQAVSRKEPTTPKDRNKNKG